MTSAFFRYVGNLEANNESLKYDERNDKSGRFFLQSVLSEYRLLGLICFCQDYLYIQKLSALWYIQNETNGYYFAPFQIPQDDFIMHYFVLNLKVFKNVTKKNVKCLHWLVFFANSYAF